MMQVIVPKLSFDPSIISFTSTESSVSSARRPAPRFRPRLNFFVLHLLSRFSSSPSGTRKSGKKPKESEAQCMASRVSPR